MGHAYKSSFDRAFKDLSPDIQSRVADAIDDFLDCLEKRTSFPEGLGFKPIGRDYYEIRADIRIRIIFQMEQRFVEFYFVGNHDRVRRFIRN